jgi:hypothetical protein
MLTKTRSAQSPAPRSVTCAVARMSAPPGLALDLVLCCKPLLLVPFAPRHLRHARPCAPAPGKRATRVFEYVLDRPHALLHAFWPRMDAIFQEETLSLAVADEIPSAPPEAAAHANAAAAATTTPAREGAARAPEAGGVGTPLEEGPAAGNGAAAAAAAQPQEPTALRTGAPLVNQAPAPMPAVEGGGQGVAEGVHATSEGASAAEAPPGVDAPGPGCAVPAPRGPSPSGAAAAPMRAGRWAWRALRSLAQVRQGPGARGAGDGNSMGSSCARQWRCGPAAFPARWPPPAAPALPIAAAFAS